MRYTEETPLFWPAYLQDGALHVLDETLIPERVEYITVRNTAQAVKVIREMKTRAFGQFLVVLNTFLLELQHGSNLSGKRLVSKMESTARALNASRPTFPFAEVTAIVVGWTRKAVADGHDPQEYLQKNIFGYLNGIRYRRLERVQNIAAKINDGDSILTHCNVSGELALAAGLCLKQSKKVKFYATETRPYFQGAKLTAWELHNAGVPVVLVADNAVGALMAEGFVNKVIVGSDRSCANGDFANKIGTYQIALVAKEFGIPFYVLTQPSNKVKKGEDIPIEIRDPKELLFYRGKAIVQGPVKGFYPGFDVVPHKLVTGSIAIHANA